MGKNERRRRRNTYFERILSARLIVAFLILFTVNNENILTDGRRYRKRPNIETQFICLV